MGDSQPPPPPPPPPSSSQPAAEEANGSKKKRKLDYKENQQPQQQHNNDSDNDDSEEEEEEEEDEVGVEVKPIGNAVRVSGEIGSILKNHFIGFQSDALPYYLEDVVLVVPEGNRVDVRPSVAIIKPVRFCTQDVTTIKDGSVTVTGQRLYRPETAKKENVENWKSREARELFYSFDKYEFPADDVMHKCQVHFVPSSKKIPSANKNPGFIVQKVYDSASKKLHDLTNTGYEDYKQHEIDVLVMITVARIPNWE